MTRADRRPATSRHLPAAPGRPTVTGGTRSTTSVALALALAGGLVGALPGVAAATPPAPTTALPVAVEDLQPYVGQAGCDPVAKPGVAAFQSMLMNTYRDTGSSGIVRDCGIGGQSEHKEGRALDWQVSIANPSHVREVNEVLGWLTATVDGVPSANARRLGIMYMIWNRQIWGSYRADQGWQPYTGPVPHTDHVHFSFGWNAAYRTTSWWTGKVAPISYGPYAAAPPTRLTPPPVRDPANLRTVATYGSQTVRAGSSGTAVALVQKALGATADGSFGPLTEARVRDFQTDEGFTVDGVFTGDMWQRLFPRPVDPFGVAEQGSMTSLSGWVADADTTGPLTVNPSVDGTVQPTGTVASAPRNELVAAYPGANPVGYTVPVDVPAGTHTVCAVAVNAGPGTSGPAGCRSVTVATGATRPGHWVNALYQDFLGRPSDPGGLDYWYGQLQSGAAPSREALAYRFATSDEYLGIVVTDYYRRILGREPDAAGLASWRGAMAAGTSPALTAGSFYASDERYAAAGGTDGAWVDSLYRGILNRVADPAGRAYWVAQTAARGRGFVASSFYGSDESLRARVEALYQRMLGRDADAEGLRSWPAQVRDRGDLVLASSLAASPEYDSRAQGR